MQIHILKGKDAKGQKRESEIAKWIKVENDLLACAENTHHSGKYHCTADHGFDGFGFDPTSKAVAHST